MDNITEFIKTYVRQVDIKLNMEKLKVISTYGYYKIYYNSDFISYIDIHTLNDENDGKLMAFELMKSINNYNEYIKKKVHPILLCITNNDESLINYILKKFTEQNYLKIILIGPNDKFINYALTYNTDYIISPKTDYQTMIQTGLTYIKTSSIITDKVLVINTDTLIDTKSLSLIYAKFNHFFGFAGPSSLKLISKNNNNFMASNITIDKLFICNWFLINRHVLDKLNWNLFNGPIDIYDLLDAFITRHKFKILPLNNFSICFNYQQNKLIKRKDNENEFDELCFNILKTYSSSSEDKNLSLFLDKIDINQKFKISDLITTKNNFNKTSKSEPVNLLKNYSKPKTITTYNLNENIVANKKITIDKYYFILNNMKRSDLNDKIKDLQNIDKLNYSIISDNGTTLTRHIKAIKDALTRKLNNIFIIDDKLICNEIFGVFNRIDIMPSLWHIILIVGTKKDIKIEQMTQSNKFIFDIPSFSYSINKSIFSEFISASATRTTLSDTIFSLQSKGTIYMTYDNFNINNFVINRAGKTVGDIGKPMSKINRNNINDKDKDKDILVMNIGNKELKEMRKIHQNKETIISRNIIKGNIQSNISYKSEPNLINSPDSKLFIINQNKSINKNRTGAEFLDFYRDNKIVQSLWIGESLSLVEILCITSFINNGHEFHLYVYDDVKNIPTECIVKNANEIIPKSEIFYYNEKQSISGEKRPTAFSNMFRYKLLYEKGNYWVDMDMICVRYLNFPEIYVFSSESTFSRAQTINAGIIKCPKKSDVMKYCYEECLKKDKENIKWGEIGPSLISKGIYKYELNDYVKPWDYFCPIGYDKLDDLITPSNSKINQNSYCIHLWNEFWVKNKLDKNKIYYGSLYYNLLNKNCRKYLSTELFNLEQEYGKYNKTAVLFYWMPRDEDMINEMESLLNNPEITNIYNSNIHIYKEEAVGNQERIYQFINGDIYAYMFTKLLELGVIDNIHIIFGMAKNDKYVYNNEPLFVNGNHYRYSDQINLWKINSIKSLLSFANAKVYFYKGYGNYEHFYSILTGISPNSIFIRYLATAIPFINKNNNIILDDNWVVNYAQNHLCKSRVKNFNKYFSKYYTNYDMLYVDTIEKVPNYKKVFTNTKKFIKLNKYSLMNFDETAERTYDLLFCASDAHPSKNWEIFYNFLMHCEKNKRELKVLIITPINKENSLQKYKSMKYVRTNIQRGLTSDELNKFYNQCNTLLITYGRDANPRVLSEAISCGCFAIVLDILSDGKDIIKNRPQLGKLIKIPQKNTIYETSYKSLTCILTPEQQDEIYNLAKKEYNHKQISDSFKEIYSKDKNINELKDFIYNTSYEKQKLVVTLATEDYSNNLNCLLSSIKHTNPTQSVLVYCVNWKSRLVNDFKSNYQNYYFSEIKLKSYTKGDIIKLKVKLQHDIYFYHRLPFIWIDADSLVLRSLKPIFDKIKDNTFICYYRPDEPHYMKFAVAVISFGISDQPDEQKINEEFLIKYYENSLKTSGYNDWFYDQTSLYETFVDYEDELKLYALSENEHSINDTINTIVYSRRMHNKKTLKEILNSYNITEANINFEGINFKYT